MHRCQAVVQGIAVVVAALSVGVPAAQADFVPAPGSPYATGNEPYSVNPGRFNADALTDLLVVNGTSSTVNMFHQVPGNGGFTAAASPFPVGSGPNFAAVADFNGDGRQDLAVSNFLSDSVSIELQQAAGTFTAEATVNIPGESGAIGAGDFNGDGRADLAVADYDHGTVGLYLRKGDNTGFVAGSSISTGGASPRYLAVGDLDGTGAPDIAVTNSGTNTVGALLVKPGATLAPAPGSPYPVGDNPQFVVVGPLNAGDAMPDIATANYGSGDVTVLLRQAGGGFAQPGSSPVAVGSHPVGLAAGDLRGTGRLDLVTANGGDGTFSVLDNTGDGFTRSEDVPVAAGGAPYGIAVGSFNDGDDFPDVAVTSLVVSPNTLSVFVNRPPPKATTGEATEVDTASATLNATVNPQGTDSDAYFEYGPTAAYGSRIPAGGELPVGSDRGDHAVSRRITDLAAGATYHFRVVAHSAGGTTRSADRAFTTAAAGPEPPPTGPAPPPSAIGGPPQASLSAPAEVAVGAATTLSAEGSTPAGGLTYRLDLDGSGAYATDLKTVRSLQTTFTTPGDVTVGLRVTDQQGRTDTVRRTVHVTSAPVYALTVSPSRPKPGQPVKFAVRQLVDDSKSFGVAAAQRLDPGSLATMTFGDGKALSSTVRGVLVRDRLASATGSFAHTFDRTGRFTIHVNVDDGNGFIQGVDTIVNIGAQAGYQPAISTATTTVQQGSCVSFSNATGTQLSVDDVGQPKTRDVNPKNLIINVLPGAITFGGGVNFRDFAVTPDLLASSRTVIAGSPLGNLDLTAPSALSLQFRRQAAVREAEEVVTTNGAQACQLQANLESAAAVYAPPVAKDTTWPDIPECPNGLKLTTYSTDQKLLPDLVTQQTQTTRHTFFSLNRWSFGDGSKSGPEAYLPTYTVYHPYDKGGTFNVSLATTSPQDLKGQVAAWKAGCSGNPLNATKDGDSRFQTRTTSLKLRVLAHYDRLRMRGLWMTSGADFSESDLPGVYQSTGPIYVNTRRVGYGWNKDRSVYNDRADVNHADGVLVVQPDDGPLQIVPDQGEILGAAHLFWQSGGEQVALGPMPRTIGGTPGLVIPAATNGNQHDLGVFNDPPAKIVTGPAPQKGQAFYVNAAHVVLREGNGGLLELNIHTPEPLGPDGSGSDQTIVRDVRGNSRAATRAGAAPRGLLDDVDVTLPAIDLAPGIVSFNGGTLSHHVGQSPPWQATGSLTVLGKSVSMAPDSKKQGCPVVGGLGFFEDGGLANAGAVLDGLQIPIPNPPAPPFAALASPALEIMPATASRPLDLFGCLTMQDYPTGNTFQVIGCAGLLLAGSGKSIPVNAAIPFCPDQTGKETFGLTDQNSTPDPANPQRRILRGVVLRVSGTLALGPTHFRVANSYLEYRDSPFTIEAKAHIGQDFLDGHLSITGDVFGNFRALDDWAVGGEGSVKQDIICVPFTDVCPGASIAVLVSPRGFGGCTTIFGIGVGGSVDFRDASLHPHVGDCGLQDLKDDLGVVRRSVLGAGPLAGGGYALRAAPSTSTSVDLSGGSPYAMVVVNGTDHSPVVQVKDPSGKVALDDNGQAVQGLKAPGKPPAAVDLATDTPPAPNTAPPASPQGILHSDISTYHDDKIDLRHTTLLLIRKPKKGRYTITTKADSSPIVGLSHTEAYAEPAVDGGVVKAKSGRMLSLKSTLPAGTTMVVSEEGRNFSREVTRVTPAQRVRRLAFTPAVGPAGTRKIVGVVSRGGLPVRRIVLGTYKAPAAARAGKVKKLKASLAGSALRVSWAPASNAQKYTVKVALKHGLSVTRTVAAKTHRLVVRDAVARLGATVTVTPIGPLTIAGPAAKRRVAPAPVKRIKRFVL